MEYTTLGRTGLKVSIMGLGCGGKSRLGLGTGKDEANAVKVIETALEMGINFIDTAEAYGTEAVVGQAIKGKTRENIIISTKKWLLRDNTLCTAAELRTGLEQSLSKLNTDYVDIYHLHAVRAENYEYTVTELLPVLQQMVTEGKIRHIGLTEAFAHDSGHVMLQTALKDNYWEVIMVGFNLVNQTARTLVFPHTQVKEIGILLMFAVRNALRNFETVREALKGLAESGQIEISQFDPERPLGFLLEDGKATSLTDAAYRFCRYEPGVDIVLSGSGSAEHMRENVASLLKPPLPPADVELLKTLFANVNNFTGN